VYYEPTFNPCTPCGPACWTEAPGATNVNECSEYDCWKRLCATYQPVLVLPIEAIWQEPLVQRGQWLLL
jgi:hypothetical protein